MYGLPAMSYAAVSGAGGCLPSQETWLPHVPIEGQPWQQTHNTSGLCGLETYILLLLHTKAAYSINIIL